MTTLVQFLATPDGPFGVLVDDEGRVLASGWTDSADALLARLPAGSRPGDARPGSASSIVEAVEAYYSGEHSAIDAVPVRQDGGPFRTEAWLALRRIAPGRTMTYSEFALAAGRPAAVRAAASACARNAVALFVPCHRVLRTDGTLGGFAWGNDVKRSLLTRESASSDPTGSSRPGAAQSSSSRLP